MRRLINRFIYGRKLFQPLFEKLHFISLYGMNIGSPIDVKSSGEKFAISLIEKCFGSEGKIYIFDIGANVGQFADLILSNLNSENILIYSFEPQREAFNQFENNIQNPRVYAFNFGLSDREGTATFFSHHISTLSSLYETSHLYGQNFAVEKQEVALMTIDQFVEEKGIDKIHYLKMDVEGHEKRVLLGAAKTLANRKIDIIQFEAGRANIAAKVFIRDFFDILSEHYDLYRLLKDGLSKPLEYSEQLEIFATTIYIAIRKDLDVKVI